MRVATEEFCFCYVVLLLLNWSWSYNFGLGLGLNILVLFSSLSITNDWRFPTSMPKTKLAETVQIVVFGTETEFRLVFSTQKTTGTVSVVMLMAITQSEHTSSAFRGSSLSGGVDWVLCLRAQRSTSPSCMLDSNFHSRIQKQRIWTIGWDKHICTHLHRVKTAIVQFSHSEWVSRVLRPARHIMGHFRDVGLIGLSRV